MAIEEDEKEPFNRDIVSTLKQAVTLLLVQVLLFVYMLWKPPLSEALIKKLDELLIGIKYVSKVSVHVPISLTSTDIIHKPNDGKKIRLKLFIWSSNADIVTALRFGTEGDLLFPIQAKGVVGMNLVGCNIEGKKNESLYGYLSEAGTMKGTVLIEEI